MRARLTAGGILFVSILPGLDAAQVDRDRAAVWFQEAKVLCEREAGRLWGQSLCGPIVIADPATGTIATNQPAPDAPRPAALGYANAAFEWGGARWSALVWQAMPADRGERGRIMMHELFHRIQPLLGFPIRDGDTSHLDTPDGRYWLQLEWRALARALSTPAPDRTISLSDALAFRKRRHDLFSAGRAGEQLQEINEGLAQFTGTMAAAGSLTAAETDAVIQLATAPRHDTFVRTYAYSTGAAYGVLLEREDPGWTRRLTGKESLGDVARVRLQINPVGNADAAARRYDGDSLRSTEAVRERDRLARVADDMRRFVEGPVLVLPPTTRSSSITSSLRPLGTHGAIVHGFRTAASWGTLEADAVLRAPDLRSYTVPAPSDATGRVITGPGWRLELAPGWTVRAGPRPGDLRVVEQSKGAGMTRQDAATVVERIRRADYEGDRSALRALVDRLDPETGDGHFRARVHYWRGFALWRRAFNGFNLSVSRSEIGIDLERAVAEFEKASALDPSFHDATIGRLSCLQNLAFVHAADRGRVESLVGTFVPLAKELQASAADNPRFLWVQGASLWYALPGLTADQIARRRADALATYERGLRIVRKTPPPADPLDPAWGEPELLMNLAFSHFNATPPDRDAAEQFAKQALALVPYWMYVRDILLPQVRQTQAQRRLDVFEGQWTVRGRTFPEAYGTAAGETAGAATYRRTAQDNWLLAEVALGGTPPYGVTILIAPTPDGSYVGVAVTNMAAATILYTGRWVDDRSLEFQSAPVESGRLQRVRYTIASSTALEMQVTESRDGGRTYFPHSSMTLTRDR